MKTNPLSSKTIRVVMFAAALTMSISSAFAQVKIGTAPTVIGANSNLEVEANNNKKIIADKVSGTLKVENKPSSPVTDSLVTRDANGELHQMSPSRLITQQKVPTMVFSGIMTASYVIPVLTTNNAPGQQIPLVPRPGFTTGWDATARVFTIQKDGYYQIEAGLSCAGTGAGGGTNQVTRIWISNFYSGLPGGPFVYGTAPISTSYGDTQSLVWSGAFSAGTTVNLNGYTVPLGNGPATTGNCVIGYLNITKLD
ncbi:hypothetical protein [Dyadobacter diqingensis]|uniref:hypothetical protein n=1 Tax=Dyadobacter diqingensis TaxID=2938121 RepID=UPI0020C1A207|nr:hypothetical protein [Dyadobacter diqingensis]